MSWLQSLVGTDEVLARLDRIENLLLASTELEDYMAKTLDQLLEQEQTNIDNLKKNDDLDNSLLTALGQNTQLIKDLRQQLKDAGTDSAKLEQLGAMMDQVAASQQTNAQRKADAIKAGTEAG